MSSSKRFPGTPTRKAHSSKEKPLDFLPPMSEIEFICDPERFKTPVQLSQEVDQKEVIEAEMRALVADGLTDELRSE